MVTCLNREEFISISQEWLEIIVIKEIILVRDYMVIKLPEIDAFLTYYGLF